MKNKKAEVGTIVMMAVLVLVSVVAFGSSSFLAKKQTTNTKASGCGSGGAYPCDHPDINRESCPQDSLEFACCVKDDYQCGGVPRYRWYGCTGQPCGNTKINNSYGQLFGCPAGVDQNNPESCGEPAPTSSPIESPIPSEPTVPPSNGCINFGSYNACRTACFNQGRNTSTYFCNNNECCPRSPTKTVPSGEPAVTTVTKTAENCPPEAKIAQSWKGSDGKSYSSKTDTIGKDSYLFICYAKCTNGVKCIKDANKSYYMLAVNGVVNYYSDSLCKSKITAASILDGSYCYGGGAISPVITSPAPVPTYAPNPPSPSPKTPVTSDGRTCMASNTVYENQSDILKNLPCNHILVKSDGNTNIFRECPSFFQGTGCAYSCFDGEKAVNCRGVSDPWTAGSSITVMNNTGYDLTIRAGTIEPYPQVIFDETVANTQYVQGAVKTQCDWLNKVKIIIIYGDKTLVREMTCGGKILINLK